MSEAATIAKPGHNNPPVVAPSEEDMLADLRNRFPEVDAELEQFEKDFATYPDKLTLKDADVAHALQDLLGKMKGKYLPKLKAYKKEEKGPWDRVAKVVMNFFTTREEKVVALQEKWGPVYADYLNQKADEAARKAEEEAERQRQAAEAARLEAEAAARREAEARQREAEALQREEEARQRAIAEETREREARERAAEAEAEERRLAAERKERERAEKETNTSNLKQIRTHMKVAENLNSTALENGDETAAAEIQQLDALIRPGGIVSLLAAPVANSALLDDEQRAEIEGVRSRLAELRTAVGERLDAKERKRRAREAKEAEEREAALAEQRRLQREEEDRLATEARLRREEAEREQAAAKQGKLDAKAEVKDAANEQRAASKDQKSAIKVGAKAGQEADRAENRADRIDRKLENSTDADLSRTRGDLGTVGSLARRWKHYVVDEAALRAVCGPLGPHFTSDALENATFHVMRAHQAGFTGERVDGATIGVPGTMFAYETDAQIR